MIQCRSVRFGTLVEIDPRSPQRELKGPGISYDEVTGHVRYQCFVVVPPPGTVILLCSPPSVPSLEPNERAGLPRDIATRMQMEQNERAPSHEPQRSPASDSPPPARPIKPRR